MAFGSVTLELFLKAAAVTNKGDSVKNVKSKLKRPVSGVRQDRDIAT